VRVGVALAASAVVLAACSGGSSQPSGSSTTARLPASGTHNTATVPGTVGMAAPTEVNISHDPTNRYGEPEIAVNPVNPSNLVYAVLVMGLTYACQSTQRPACRSTTSAYGPQPAGLMNDEPGFSHVRVYTSFDGGAAWKRTRDIPAYPPGHEDLVERGDPLLAVGPDGTFYLGWDDIHFANLPKTIIRDGGIAVSKSTDGGLTWSTPVLTGTPVDRPFFALDRSTGRIYEASSSQLGPNSTGDPTLPPTPIAGPGNDRWLVSSKDGVHWTDPRAFGGVSSFPPGAFAAATFGTFGTAFVAANSSLCGGTAGCTVFQTTTDSGATWTRHLVPVGPGYSGAPLVAGDPTTPRHFAVAVLNGTASAFLVYQTHDAGMTWSGPVTVTDDAQKTHFHPWMTYSPNGVLGLMWQTNVNGSVGTGGYPAALSESVFVGLPEAVRHAVGQHQAVPESLLNGLAEPVREAIQTAESSGPSPYSVWAAVSPDGGAHFSKPLKISKADSPAPQPFLPNGIGDDFSFIAMSSTHVYVAWADYRPGDRSAYLSAIAVPVFDRS
jgi:hypothetical protein